MPAELLVSSGLGCGWEASDKEAMLSSSANHKEERKIHPTDSGAGNEREASV